MLTEINASLFQFKKHPRFFVLYVNKQSELKCDSKIAQGVDWILFEAPEINLNERSIIEIQYEDKLVHILCTNHQVLVHTAVSHPLPNIPPLPSFIPKFESSDFATNIIQLGYALRFPQVDQSIESNTLF